MKQVLITGGSSGIGFVLARVFAKRGYRPIITGVNKERLNSAKIRLEEEYGLSVETFAQDLSEEGGAEKLYNKIKHSDIQIDILINNAGMGLLEATEKIDFAKDEALMRLNMIALVQLCKLYLPEMYERGSGKILNVASVAAYQPGPYNSTYFASKAFVLSYSRAIRFEAKDKGVQVCTLCPGTTATDFFEREGMKTPPMSVTPDKVAEYAFKKFMRNKEVIVHGAMNKFTLIIPTGLKIKLAAMMREWT